VDAMRFASLLARAAGRPLVTTGKAAARLRPDHRAQVFWRDLDVPLPEAVLRALPPLG